MKAAYYLCFLILTLPAQELPADKWHSGEIDLDNGQTLAGLVKYDFKNNLIEYRQAQVVRIFSARKVQIFQIRDTLTHAIRTFYTIPVFDSSQDLIPTFFELLLDADIALLSRSTVKYRTRQGFNPAFPGVYTESYRITGYDFYILKNYQIEPLPKDYQSFFKLLDQNSPQVKKYMRVNRLNFRQRDHLIRILKYYNQLYNAR